MMEANAGNWNILVPAGKENKQCEDRQNSFDGLGKEGAKLLYGRNHHIKDKVFQYNLFLPHQARKDTDKEKTHAAKNEILQAEHHKVDKNE